MKSNDDVYFESATDLLVQVQMAAWGIIRQLPDDVQNPIEVALILAAQALQAADIAADEQHVAQDNDHRLKVSALRRQVSTLAGLVDDDLPPAFRNAFGG